MSTVYGDAGLPHEAVSEAIEILDGHSIVKPEWLIDEVGLPREFVDTHTRVYKSNTRNHKTTIFDSRGNMQPEMKGVYALTLLYAIAEQVGADTRPASQKIGRGFQARVLCHEIRKILELSKK